MGPHFPEQQWCMMFLSRKKKKKKDRNENQFVQNMIASLDVAL